MIKAIIFDYGGVMTFGKGKSELTDKLAMNLAVSEEKASQLVGPENWRPYMRGDIDETEFWNRTEKILGSKIETNKRDVWNKWDEMKPDDSMVRLVKELRRKYKVGLLSNTIPPTAQDIKENGGYEFFDFVILSYEVGMAKPDRNIYELALSKLPDIKPEEVIFIDDLERCLVPAREMGIKTVLAKNSSQIKSDIEKLLK